MYRARRHYREQKEVLVQNAIQCLAWLCHESYLEQCAACTIDWKLFKCMAAHRLSLSQTRDHPQTVPPIYVET